MAPDESTVSTTVGWMQQWSAFGQFAGPPLAAWVAARAGGWHAMWWVTGGCAVIGMGIAGLIAAFLARHPARRPAAAQPAR
jgi:MFS family permease